MSDRLKAVPPPPTVENGRRRQARERNVRRARQAIRILERGQHVSDGHIYGSKPSARDKAVRLIAALEEHQEVPRHHVRYAVRVVHQNTKAGWRWWVWLAPEHQTAPDADTPAPADSAPARGKARKGGPG